MTIKNIKENGTRSARREIKRIEKDSEFSNISGITEKIFSQLNDSLPKTKEELDKASVEIQQLKIAIESKVELPGRDNSKENRETMFGVVSQSIVVNDDYTITYREQ